MLPITMHLINNKKIKMKKLLSVFILAMAVLFTACNSGENKNAETTTITDDPNQLYACSMDPEIIGKKDEKCSKCGMKLTVPVKATLSDTAAKNATTEQLAPTSVTPATTENSPVAKFSIATIVSNYIALKNALTKDDSKAAANAGKAMIVAFGKLDMKSLSNEQMKSYMDMADNAKEHAEHIGDNGGKLDHQREHFALLSKDVNDLIKAFGSSTKLYQDFCPMYDDGKGAIWISETKEIKNPYFGTQMLTCGSVKKEF